MDDQLAALATSAATTVVNSLTSEAWQRTRAGVVRLWSRYRPDPDSADPDRSEPGADLDHTRAQLLGTGERALEPALIAVWEARFRQLLETDPAASLALSRLVADLSGGEQPDGAGDTESGDTARPTPAHVEISGEATGHGIVIQAGHTVNVTKP